MSKMDEKNIYSWFAALLIAAGLWMFYVALTGYPWWFTIIQKTNWLCISAVLTVLGIGVFIIKILGREKKDE